VKRFLILFFFFAPTIIILSLVIYRMSTQETDIAKFGKFVDATLKKWNTRSTVAVTNLDYNLLRETAVESTMPLTEDQKTKLLDSLTGFWKCYSQTNFEKFREFRLNTPYEIDEKVLDTLKFAYPKSYQPPATKDSELEQAWGYYSGTNCIVRIDTNSIKITVGYLTDRRQGIFKSANAELQGAAVGYMPELVIARPTAKQIYAKDGKVLYATVEQFVIFNTDTDQVCPLFVAFYWADSLKQWMPYEMAKIACGWRSLL
jgi:hypothetical protein